VPDAVNALGATILRLAQEVSPTDGAREDPWTLPAEIGDGEWTSAKLSPDCIVEKYLFADVACLFAPGGTGKTTETLYEAVHIVLGRDLWGLRIWKPGPVLYLTAEDRREFLVARLREICDAMQLSPADLAKVRRMVRIDDCTRHPRRLTAVVGDMVMASEFGSDVVAACKFSGFQPVLVQFDPMVSFGVGESRVNDSEQGLIEAARVISGGLNACVRYVHHTGKGNARDKLTDQYAGRNGSALPDGSRMVNVMQPMDAGEWKKVTGDDLEEGDNAFVLARPKLSYAPPQPNLYIHRRGYSFTSVEPLVARSPDDERDGIANQVWLLLKSEFDQGRLHSRNSIIDMKPKPLSRDQMRAALSFLESSGRLVESKRPESVSHGARSYLHPVVAARD